MKSNVKSENETTILTEKPERITQEETNIIILFMLTCLFFYIIGYRILQMIMGEVPKYVSSRMMEIISVIHLIIYPKFTCFRLYHTGLVATKNEIKRTLIRCGLISLGIIIALVIARLVMTQFNSEIATRPWFYPYFDINMRWLYPFVVILQEFLAKGMLQESMKRLMGEKHINQAIWACGILFTIFHLGYPLYYMICAGLLMVVTGYIYEKDHSIWGCCLIHFCIGFLPRAMGLK